MNDLPSQEVLAAVEAIRRAWERSPEGPDLLSLLPSGVLRDERGLAEVIAADVEERAKRGIEASLALYLGMIPGLTSMSEACRAIIMHELARASGGKTKAAAESMSRRYPELRSQIEMVSELCEALQDSVEVAFDTSDISAEAGQRLAKYELVARLGKGSFGDVWQALDTELDRFVALKLLHADPSRGEAATLERVMAEARAAAGLAHENIVTVHAADRKSVV